MQNESFYNDLLRLNTRPVNSPETTVSLLNAVLSNVMQCPPQ